MPVPASINDLSTTAGNNSPAGSESPTTTDDYLRAHASFIATVRDSASTSQASADAAQASADAAQASADAAYRTSNILGTVSQSAGVPTGAIIERGINANGEYTRWADGTQICTADVPTSNSADATWTFPAGFATGSTPRVTGNSSDSSSTTCLSLKTHTTSNLSTRLMLITGANARSSGVVSVKAHGRWY